VKFLNRAEETAVLTWRRIPSWPKSLFFS